jgi:arginine decarboxylase
MRFELERFRKHYIRRIAELDAENLAMGFGTLLSELWDEFDYSLSSPQVDLLTSKGGPTDAFNSWLADRYGAQAARIGVSGSSLSNVSVIGFLVPGLLPERDLFVCERDAHKSVFGGAIASGKKIVLLDNVVDPSTGIRLPLAPDQLKQVLSLYGKRVAAVCLTSPTYEGVVADLPSLARLCTQNGSLLIVDAAWGSTFGLFPDFPDSPIQHSDIVVTSPHKSGLAPSQVSLVLFQSDESAIEFDRVCELGLVTTSPNRLLLAIAEYRFLMTQSPAAIAAWAGAAMTTAALRDSVPAQIEGIQALTAGGRFSQELNPVQLCLSTRGAGIDARDWAKRLREDHAIDPEYASETLLVLLLGPDHSGQQPFLHDRLVAACPPARGRRGHAGSRGATHLVEPQSTPIDMRTHFFVRKADRHRASVSSELVVTYPPGRPICVPGEPCLRSERRDGLSIETIDPRQATEQQKHAYAGLFMEVFANAPFNQFAFDPSDPLTPVSVAQALSQKEAPWTHGNLYMDEESLLKTSLPSPLERWVDIAVCHDQIDRRCQDPGGLTLVYDGADLAGALHARSAPLGQIFETEEWRDPLLFSRHKGKIVADAKTFSERMRYHFGLTMDDQILTVSCMALRPAYRGSLKLVFNMFDSLAGALPHTLAALPMLAEIPGEGAARTIDIALNERVVHGILPNGHSVVFSRRADTALQPVKSGYRAFSRVIRDEVRASRLPWRPSATDHPAVETRSTGTRGMGVFAIEDIAAGEIIAVFEGERYVSDSATGLPAQIVNHAIQVGVREYVSNEGGLAERINHACDPNAGIRGLASVVSLRPIKAGEEITWDYRCSEDSDWVLDPCLCGSANCAGRVGGHSSLPARQRAFYRDVGAVSDWLMARDRAESETS